MQHAWTIATRLGCLTLAFGFSHALTFDAIRAQETKVVPTESAKSNDAKKDEAKKEDAAKDSASEKWKPLLKQDSLDGWESTNFGGEGAVEVSEGVLKIERGEPLTGITYKGKDFPLENYELRWKAQRVEGSDFFAGVTFPVGKEHCSFICGGWGGGLVGLSSINGNDASENETARLHSFKNGTWYSFRIRVDANNVTVWMEDKEIIQVERTKKFSLRGEVLKSRPLGYCVFRSMALVKDWEYRLLDDAKVETKAVPKSADPK